MGWPSYFSPPPLFHPRHRCLVSDCITSTCCGFVVQLFVQQAVRQIHNKSKANSKSATSCRTSGKSYNKLDNLPHSKSATKPHQVACNNQQVLQQLVATYLQLVANRSNGVRHLPDNEFITRGVDPYGTGGKRPPIFGLGDIITNVPPIFLE